MVLTYTHSRADWLGSERWEWSPPFPGWDEIRLFVVHWPGHDGAIDGDPGEFAHQLDDFLRQMHRNYLNRKPNGFNVGYNVAVDWLGGTWELRGDEFKCAANAGLNDIGFACIVLCDLDGVITTAAKRAVAGLWRQAKALQPSIRMIGHGEGPELYPHRDPTPTQCPGPLQQYVDDGTFTATPPPPTPIPTDPVEDSMIPVVCKTTDGPFLASLGHNTQIFAMGDTPRHEVTTDYVFGRGDGHAFDAQTRRVVSWSVDSGGSWSAIRAVLTTEEAKARMVR